MATELLNVFIDRHILNSGLPPSKNRLSLDMSIRDSLDNFIVDFQRFTTLLEINKIPVRVGQWLQKKLTKKRF